MRKKVLNIFILIVTLFLFNFDGIKAMEEGQDIYTCVYESEDDSNEPDGMYKANYYVKRYSYDFSDGFDQIIEITHWEGNDVADNIEALGGQHKEKIVLRNECPTYLSIKKLNFADYDVVDYGYLYSTATDKNDADTKVLELQNNYFEMYDAIRAATTSTISKYALDTSNTLCQNGLAAIQDACQLPEKTYECSYKIDDKKNLNLTFNENFTVAMKKVSGLTSFSGTNPGFSYITDGLCPSTVFEIDKDGKKAYTYNNGGSWPSLCSESGYTCYKYTNGNTMVKYKEKVKAQSVIRTAEYYLHSIGVNENNKLEIKIDGKDDGVISNFSMVVNGKNAYFASNNPTAGLNYFKNMLSSNSEFPNRIYCVSEMKDGYSLLKLNGNTPPANFDGVYCHSLETGGKEYAFASLYEKNSDNVNGTGNGNLIATAKDLNANLVKEYKNSICATQPNSDECKNYQNNLYKKVKESITSCQKVFANPNSDATEVAECRTLNDKTEKWASDGYFGNNVISSTGTGCTETLGSLGEWLTRIYKILLLAVPVIIMVFGFKDFMKAILNGKEDELKKAGSTFIKRLIFGAVFVALPIFIKVILSLALGGSFSDICIL